MALGIPTLPADAPMQQLLAAEMEAGSAIIYSGNSFHAGGANTSARSSRRGLYVSYCLG